MIAYLLSCSLLVVVFAPLQKTSQWVGRLRPQSCLDYQVQGISAMCQQWCLDYRSQGKLAASRERFHKAIKRSHCCYHNYLCCLRNRHCMVILGCQILGSHSGSTNAAPRCRLSLAERHFSQGCFRCGLIVGWPQYRSRCCHVDLMNSAQPLAGIAFEVQEPRSSALLFIVGCCGCSGGGGSSGDCGCLVSCFACFSPSSVLFLV